MVLNQLQIFSQLHLIELLGLLTGLGLLQLWHLIYPRLLTGFGMLVFFPNLSLMEFQVRHLALLLLFSIIDSFELLWVESLHKNFQLMLEFLETLFLILSSWKCYRWYCYLCKWYYWLLSSWSGIWSGATTWIGFWTWIWSMRHCGLGQEITCWFQWWENSAGFVWPV